MRIKELSLIVGIPVETIRYYERSGLIPQAVRLENNYREYRQSDIERLHFIRNCRSLDMSLDEIRELIAFIDQTQQQPDLQADCHGVHSIVAEHLGHVQHRIKSLQILEKQLKSLLKACDFSTPAQACEIVKELFAEKESTPLTGSGHGVHTT